MTSYQTLGCVEYEVASESRDDCAYAADWIIANRDFINEDVVRNNIVDFPKAKWNPLKEEDCYTISFRRIRHGKPIVLEIWFHEYPDKYLVYKCHHY